MRLKISVNQNHIDLCVPGSARFCAISKAIKDTGGPNGELLRNPLTGHQYVELKAYRNGQSEVGKYFRLELPVRAQRFVRRLDKQGKAAVKPLSFFITIPEDSLS